VRELDGWSQVFYADNPSNILEEKSLKRYYNMGVVVMKYAFKNNNIQKMRIDSIKVFCDEN